MKVECDLMNAKKYKIILPVLVLVVLLLYLVFFRQGQINSRDVKTGPDFLQYLDQNGTRTVSWSDFDHLPHEKDDADEGHTVTYRLKDGCELLFSGDSLDQPPRWISLNLEKASIQPQDKEGKIEPKSIQTREDVIRYVGQVGGDHVTWSDFDHLPHLPPEEGASGLYMVIYTLKDGSMLSLSGPGEDQAPWFINLSLTPDKK